MVSKPDLVTFLEQMQDLRNIRRMETVGVYPGRCEWMEPMTQVRSPVRDLTGKEIYNRVAIYVYG